MSTPPFVDLPPGVVADRWLVRGTGRAVLHAGLAGSAGERRGLVVLVPGFTGSKEDFIAVLPLIADAGYAVVSYDQLGQFESDASADPRDYRLSALAGDVAELCRLAEGRVGATATHLVGHSFGGLVVQEAVAGGHLRPDTVTLLCTGPGALPQDRWQGLPDLVDALAEHDLATIWRLMQELSASSEPAAERPDPQVQAFLERRWHANSPVQLACVAELLMGQPDLTGRVADATAGITVTVIWGEHDDAWPVEQQRRMAAALGADALELPGLGHSPNAEDPAATVAALLAALPA